MSKTKTQASFSLNLPTLLTIGSLIVIVALAVLVWRSNHPATPAASPSTSTSSKAEPSSSQANNTPASTPSNPPATPAAGNNAQVPSSNAAPSSTDAVASSGMPAPTGQILNKGKAANGQYISLSATPPESQYGPGMVSTCSSVSGATCEIIAYTDPAHPMTVSGPAKVDDTYYSAELDWNAKTVGLQPGTWWVRAVAHLNGAGSYSAAYQLDVRP